MTLLTRMQTSKTESYVYLFMRFILYTMAINVEGLSPDYIIGTIEAIQPQQVNPAFNLAIPNTL
jgi:exportin-2 (importin alpha re-exporter)